MARGEERITPPNDKKNEQVQVLGGGEVPEIKLPHVDQLSNAVKASAVDNNTDTFEERTAAEPALFGMVVETKLVHDNRAGGRVTLRAGKVLSSQHYDLAHLARQGLKMKKHEPEKAMPVDQMFVD